jgi:hypothetical protein
VHRQSKSDQIDSVSEIFAKEDRKCLNSDISKTVIWTYYQSLQSTQAFLIFRRTVPKEENYETIQFVCI